MSTDKDKNIVKPHYFELVMKSYSGGILNQEVVIVREYAQTPSELTVKQMGFTKSAAIPIMEAVIKAMDEMSMPLQEQGLKELTEAFEEMTKGNAPAAKKPAGKR